MKVIDCSFFILHLKGRTAELKTYITTAAEVQLSFPLILSEQNIRDEYHISVLHYYPETCCLYNHDTKERLLNFSKDIGHLILPIPKGYIVNMIQFRTTT